MTTLPPFLISRQRRFASALGTAVLALLLAAALGVGVAAAAGIAPHVELSDSMRPVLRAGDVVWLERIAARDARVGDVVAFDDPKRDAVLLHRVERVRPAPLERVAFRTRGDANNGSESWAIAGEGRIGRYVGVRVPVAGRAVRALHGAPLAIVAVLSGAALAGLALRRIWA
jgi:signal peptidase I